MKVQGRDVVHGVDVSNWQGTIDFDAVKRAGIKFVIAKATEGIGYNDPTYTRNRRECERLGITFGAYHWLKPKQPWNAQVAKFIQATGAAAGCAFVMLDAEEEGITDEQVVNWAETVHDQTGKPVVIYCGTWTDPRVRSDRWLKFAPCLAAYSAGYAVDPDPSTMKLPVPPKPWGFWTMWQYTSSGVVPGIAGHCDRDVLDAAWFAKLGTEAPETDEPSEEDDDMASILVQDPDGDQATWELLGLQRRRVYTQDEIDILRFFGSGYFGGDTDENLRRQFLAMRTPLLSVADVVAAINAAVGDIDGVDEDEVSAKILKAIGEKLSA